jgi:hypothetical protein
MVAQARDTEAIILPGLVEEMGADAVVEIQVAVAVEMVVVAQDARMHILLRL